MLHMVENFTPGCPTMKRGIEVHHYLHHQHHHHNHHHTHDHRHHQTPPATPSSWQRWTPSKAPGRYQPGTRNSGRQSDSSTSFISRFTFKCFNVPDTQVETLLRGWKLSVWCSESFTTGPILNVGLAPLVLAGLSSPSPLSPVPWS